MFSPPSPLSAARTLTRVFTGPLSENQLCLNTAALDQRDGRHRRLVQEAVPRKSRASCSVPPRERHDDFERRSAEHDHLKVARTGAELDRVVDRPGEQHVQL